MRELHRIIGGMDGAHGPNTLHAMALKALDDWEREAIAWVREHGGLEKIIQQRRDSVPRAAYERKLGKRLRHIAECEEALRRRNVRIAALEKASDILRRQIAEMRPRLMPSGMEWLVESWPRFEDGEPVEFGDELPEFADTIYKDVATVKFLANGLVEITNAGGSAVRYVDLKPGERVKRPAPVVLDADGAEIRVGDEVWVVGDAWPSMKVLEIKPDDDPDVPEHLVWCGETFCEPLSGTKKWRIANQLTHRAPVLDADGRPLREGETVWDTKGNGPYIIDGLEGDGVVRIKGNDLDYFGADFIHERPDSWERLEHDAEKTACEYFGANYDCANCPLETARCAEEVKKDIIRRAKKLAERGA